MSLFGKAATVLDGIVFGGAGADALAAGATRKRSADLDAQLLQAAQRIGLFGQGASGPSGPSTMQVPTLQTGPVPMPQHQQPAQPQGLPGFQQASPLLALATMAGKPWAAGLTNLLDKNRPDIAYEGGVQYDRHNPNSAPKSIPKLDNNLVLDPTTGKVTLAPGAVEGVTALEAAKGAGTAQHNIITVPTADGRSLQMTQSEFEQIPPNIKAQMGIGVAPSEAQVAGAKSAATAPYDLVTVDNGGRATPMSRAQALGVGGPGSAGMRDPRLGGPGQSGAASGPIQGLSPSETAEAAKIGGATGDRYNKFISDGQAAQGPIDILNIAHSLIKNYEGGKLTGTGMELASVFNSLGLPIDKNLGNKEAADALLTKGVMDSLGGSLGPGISNADVSFISKTQARVGQTKKGRDELIGIAINAAKRKQSIASFAQKWREKYGSIDKGPPGGAGFDTQLRMWAAKNPMFPQK